MLDDFLKFSQMRLKEQYEESEEDKRMGLMLLRCEMWRIVGSPHDTSDA